MFNVFHSNDVAGDNSDVSCMSIYTTVSPDTIVLLPWSQNYWENFVSFCNKLCLVYVNMKVM